MTRTQKERRLRDMAREMGYHIRKSRVRDPDAPGYRRYELIANDGRLIFTPGPTGEPSATLDQIEEYLTAGDPFETEPKTADA